MINFLCHKKGRTHRTMLILPILLENTVCLIYQKDFFNDSLYAFSYTNTSNDAIQKCVLMKKNLTLFEMEMHLQFPIVWSVHIDTDC